MKTFDKTALLAAFDRVFAEARTRVPPPEPVPPLPSPAPVQPVLYLPVEVKARELQAKAIVAREAVKHGFRVMIGAVWAMRAMAQALPPGVVLLKSANRVDVRDLFAWRSQGHRAAVLDEEVFGVAASPAYLTATVHPHVAALADLICAQGPAYARAFPYAANIAVTGNPRVLTYKQSGAPGTDILVCLQSGNINNNARSFDEMVAQTLELAPSGDGFDQWGAILRASIAHECDTVPLVRAIIPALAAAFPERRVIVRPHPVEDPRTWSFDQANVVLDASGTIQDAMRSAGVLVYVSGCTTGFDAYLAKIPAVRIGDGGHGISAQMHVGVTAPEQAVAAVRRAEVWRGDLGEHLAAVNLVPALAKLYRERPTPIAEGEFPVATVKPDDFVMRKFPTTSPEEISRLLGGLPTRQIAWNVFIV